MVMAFTGEDHSHSSGEIYLNGWLKCLRDVVDVIVIISAVLQALIGLVV